MIEPGLPGTWNKTAVRPGDVVKEDGLFEMWFTGGTGQTTVSNSFTAYSTGYTASPDGIAWRLYHDIESRKVLLLR